MKNAYLQVVEAFRSLRDREEGQGLVEYALIISLVSIAAITILGFLSDDINDVFQEIINTL